MTRITCLVVRALEERVLCEFLLLAEDAIIAVQWNCESGSQDFEGMLLQTELLVRDVLVEGLVEHDDGEAILGGDILQAVSGVAVQELSDKHHMSGQPEIPISEEHLAILLEYHFIIRAIANIFRVSPSDDQEKNCEVWIG